jgi:hypothetical protein
MGRFKSNIEEIAEMNLTKRAASKRAGCSGDTLDDECMRVFGKKWTELKAEQREEKNKSLSSKPVGKLSYFGPKRIYSANIK